MNTCVGSISSKPQFDARYHFVVADVLDAAENSFASTPGGAVLTRYALETAIDMLSRGARVVDYLPDLAVGDAKRRHTR